ncbi:MAG TPA: hypothetical protein VEU32_17905 [Burkholderiales bacterium]|nr:hypothetical protein [Burkholderiales bacterium]
MDYLCNLCRQFVESVELKAKKKLDRPKSKPGPEAERLKLRGDWQALVGKALSKKRPKKGWPKG